MKIVPMVSAISLKFYHFLTLKIHLYNKSELCGCVILVFLLTTSRFSRLIKWQFVRTLLQCLINNTSPRATLPSEKTNCFLRVGITGFPKGQRFPYVHSPPQTSTALALTSAIGFNAPPPFIYLLIEGVATTQKFRCYTLCASLFIALCPVLLFFTPILIAAPAKPGRYVGKGAAQQW